MAVYVSDGSCADYKGFVSSALRLVAGRPASRRQYVALHPGGVGPQTAELVALLLAFELVEADFPDTYDTRQKVTVRTDSQDAYEWIHGIARCPSRFVPLVERCKREIADLKECNIFVHVHWVPRALVLPADNLCAEFFVPAQVWPVVDISRVW